ncbi:hypothetical protein NDU88_003145 [Pleurodeles waltl]|uniref:Uncharacterized protein n=1 Tax=Pleurodeles waltl TaxID=8319 RepID=A0AAV7WS90_PLEWA|nr:hypothetical protein NDU88_003145 [Pleurodeles waltl]
MDRQRLRQALGDPPRPSLRREGTPTCIALDDVAIRAAEPYRRRGRPERLRRRIACVACELEEQGPPEGMAATASHACGAQLTRRPRRGGGAALHATLAVGIRKEEPGWIPGGPGGDRCGCWAYSVPGRGARLPQSVR